MKLKRHYDPDSLSQWQHDRDQEIERRLPGVVEAGLTEDVARDLIRQQYADAHGLPAIDYVEVLRSGPEWRPSTGIVERGAEEGWLSLGDGRLTLKTAPDEDDIRYRIVRGPGRYCCHCGARQPGEKEAQAHVATHQRPSPDPNNPAGYRNATYYECVKEADHG